MSNCRARIWLDGLVMLHCENRQCDGKHHLAWLAGQGRYIQWEDNNEGVRDDNDEYADAYA